MDFKLVLTLVSRAFKKSRVRYAVIGGVAVSLRSTARATQDLDFLVHGDDLANADARLRALGYERDLLTRNFSRYEGPVERLGLIDLQHGIHGYALRMLRRARRVRLPRTRITVPVAAPEDLIGLKAQAIANNPSRRHQDMADILSLVRTHRRRLDWNRILGYFEKLQMRPAGLRIKSSVEKER